MQCLAAPRRGQQQAQPRTALPAACGLLALTPLPHGRAHLPRRFQRREQRRGDLMDLRAKFEADKRRVADMKAARNFRPF